ncbi:MAG: SUMF1/EgtB/PvdO family nonheme iron enzyme [Bacteroidota bacterium]
MIQDSIRLPELNITVDQYEVSVNAFHKFVVESNYLTTADSIGWSGVFNIDSTKWDMTENANWERPDGLETANPNLPVTHISYFDACAYCAWKGGRLPTAKEWDAYAGKEIIIGNVWEGPFPFEDTGKDGYKHTPAPIGSFEPNSNGIHDLFGNVWEWTSTSLPDGSYILKGGSFLCDQNFCSGFIPSRFQTTSEDSGLNHLGFRCVYDL